MEDSRQFMKIDHRVDIFVLRDIQTNDIILKTWLIKQFDILDTFGLGLPDWEFKCAELLENLDKEFPGVSLAIEEATKDLWNRTKLHCYHYSYMNEIIQAWPGRWERDPNGLPPPPSRLCPNKHLFPNL